LYNDYRNQIKINFKLIDGYRNNKQFEKTARKNRTFEANTAEKLIYLSNFQNQFRKNKYKYYRQLSLGSNRN